MLDIADLKVFFQDPEIKKIIDTTWDSVGETLARAQAELPEELAMARRELSFHDHVKCLGYLCWLLEHNNVAGDIIEIGVWKGKSTSFMNEICQHKRRMIGIDPMELTCQESELRFYHERLFPEVNLIRGYSELSIERVLALNPQTVLLHIDGGHEGRHVLIDFLLYSPTVVPGGFIVFDDYRDHQYSPQVGPAVDLLRAGGYFNGFDVIGSLPGFENSYLLQKR
ncbi:class I SAM-dependent methyltransferase [Enterobacter sp. RHB15-C17]|jgi:predicted O-methyltransferase YrrM|uniref:class I SAM-dependent methyltransferase n=1 Tax=Lelliottia TaxID=1330545 RepID=UPI000C7EE927|nr:MULTISPECIES: class I SAM-dependent methyltransferase [Lelliottia]QMM54176.1 class I SAM-dependent methyltransferase [Enterobacter sp. RHB15-C17]MCD4560542.1 class I SAM-dependent methyltransferase [Lelliottia nimipressuralis]MCY1697654.1 class I SAM-dependent methyltransferase [Lelliottia sp. SL45]PLY45545.1 cephalosporin hydroxylase [Lelliottia sp. F159]PLY51706.1 cephalosporin hydroxylase [Lelliottia sp. F154]